MSFAPLPRAGAFLTVGLALLAGCEAELGPDKRVSIIDIQPKTARLYAVGQQQGFTTTLTTEAGTAGEGIEIGYLALDKTLIEVNSAGVAKALKKGGSTWVVATAGGKRDSALIEVPATSCGTTTPTTMTVGQVVTDIGDNGFCAAASTGDYAVIVHNNSLAGSGSSSVELTATAIGATAGGATFSRAATVSDFGTALRQWRRDVAAEMRHRRNEAAVTAPFAATARSWYANRSRGATRSTAAAAVGDQMRLNVNISGGCNDSTMISARVAAVSNAAIVLTDPRNPSDGFTDSELNEFAQMFDTVIHPLNVETFGAPTDLDNNQRVLIVFTRAVNERTPPGADYYIGGLTHSRDLLPKTGTGTVCAASNQAEMFYMLAPDPNREVNGNEFDKEFVSSVTDATIAHEYQHLINFARRRYLNGATPQPNEELWLNEGLSHMAEELVFHRRTGRASRSNFGGSDMNSLAIINQWLYFMSGNFLNYHDFASRPGNTSPFEGVDDIETRGATWSFLRYAADQSPADGTLWYDLVNSGESGATNLQNRLGLTADQLRGRLRDFTISVYTDDFITGVAAKYTQPSWNMRSKYPAINTIFGVNFTWPLQPIAMQDLNAVTTSIQAGGFRVYGFRGLDGTDSYIRVRGNGGTPLPANMTISVVRIQ